MEFKRTQFNPFTAEGLRIANNLTAAYDVWSGALRERESLPASMYWVRRGETEYLGVKQRSRDNGTTIGERTTESEVTFNTYQERCASLTGRIKSAAAQMEPNIRQYRALRMPVMMPRPGQILRELDISGLLGNSLMLVGTNAFAAYQIESGHRFPTGIEETEDIDFAWCATQKVKLASVPAAKRGSPLLQALRSFDPTYAINKRKPYQAVNDDAYEVELLVAPSRLNMLSADEVFSPLPGLYEQEWLLQGQPIRHVIIANDNKPCPLYVPDPRWMALHKLWLARQSKRNALKRDKDDRQGDVLLDATRHFLTLTYPLDTNFVLDLPQELREIFIEWCEARQFTPGEATPEFR